MTSTGKSVRSHQKLFVSCSLLFVLLLSILYADFPRRAKAEMETSKSTVAAARLSKNATGGCCGEDEGNTKPHLLAGSYYTTNNNFSAKLLLNNKGPLPIEVRPTLFSLSGEQFEASPVTVDANSHRFEDFADWAAIAGEQFREGSIQLFHHGKDLVLGSQIYLTDQTHSLSFDEKLTELGKPGSASSPVYGGCHRPRVESNLCSPTPQAQCCPSRPRFEGNPLKERALLQSLWRRTRRRFWTLKAICSEENRVNCGYDISWSWHWCGTVNVPIVKLASLNAEVRRDSVTLNGQSGPYSAGTAFRR